jgi:type I restriction enzyme M protein
MSAWMTHQVGEHVLLDDQLFEVTQAARTRWGSTTYRVTAGDGSSRWLTPRRAEALAPYVDAAAIERMVHAFYGRIREDAVLGPIFDARIADWGPHLARMVHFWSAVLLAAPGFMGNPMQKHRELTGVAPQDFERWLGLFGETLGEIFEPPVADAILLRARRIAGRLSGAMFEEGFEAKLWQMADKLRNNMDAAEYKHVVLGLIFLKYISDAFEEKHAALVRPSEVRRRPGGPRRVPRREHLLGAEGARWSHLQARQAATIGKLIDDAMVAIERDNPTLKGVLPRTTAARPRQDAPRRAHRPGRHHRPRRQGEPLARRARPRLRVLPHQFAAAEGKNGGQFYTPRGVVRVLVEMLAPYKGRVFDPAAARAACSSQSEKFVEAHGGRVGDISIYGQESNHTTWRLAKLNLAIRGIDANIVHGDTFHADGHKDLKADYVIANPPFNDSDWGGERLRTTCAGSTACPPPGNANFAWVQHFLHHLAPTGIAGFVLANGSMSSQQSGEGEIRKAIVEADLVDCMVALPGQLFYSTQIPVCLWFLARDKKNGLGGRGKKMRNRSGRRCSSTRASWGRSSTACIAS